MQNLVTEICPTTAQRWVKNRAWLVDVREKEEMSEVAFDVPHILHIPLSEFEDRYPEIPKDTDVIIVCRSGDRSLRAAGYLIHHGYDAKRVVHMKHGLIRWVQKGFPVIGNDSFAIENSAANTCCS